MYAKALGAVLLSWSFVLSTFAQKPCGTPPENPISREVFALGATLSWDSVPNATSYIAYVRPLDNPKWQSFRTAGAESAVLASGLRASTVYKFQVLAFCGEDKSPMTAAQFNTSPISKREAAQKYTVMVDGGFFYDSGGNDKNYEIDEAWAYTIVSPTKQRIKLSFTEFDLGVGDTLLCFDGMNIEGKVLGKFVGGALPPVITTKSNSLTFLFISDGRDTRTGWKATWTTAGKATSVADVPTPKPTNNNTGKTTPKPSTNTGSSSTARTNTQPTTPPQKNNDKPQTTPAKLPTTAPKVQAEYAGAFSVMFEDKDNSGRGIAQRFYNIAQKTSEGYLSNAAKGFFYDDFDAASEEDWAMSTGKWVRKDGVLMQTSNDDNTNLYTELTQQSKGTYLYAFSAALGGNPKGTRRLGLHFFCNEPTKDQRGDGYFMFVRDREGDKDNLELYKVENNVFSLKQKVDIRFTTDKMYDYKLLYTPDSGTIAIYFDNALALKWRDDKPQTTGKYISFRTGNATATIDNFVVCQSRSVGAVAVRVDKTANSDIMFNTAVEQLRISSWVLDGLGRWSALTQEDTKVRLAPEKNTATNATARVSGEDGKATSTKAVAADVRTVGKPITGDFPLTFPAEKGILERFYMLANYDPSVKAWHANTTLGFVCDEFAGESLENEWTSQVGKWEETAGELRQMADTAKNSNAYLPVAQQADGKYLYHFQAKILQAGDNRRFGLHFFCDDPASENRGRSYLLFFRNNDVKADAVELYRCEGGKFQLMKTMPATLQANTWLDIKLVFDPRLGAMTAYLDDAVLIYHKDDKIPFSTGKAISLRTGSAQVAFDNVRVYKQYTAPVEVEVGTALDSHLRFNSAGSQPAARTYMITRNTEARFSPTNVVESVVNIKKK